MNQCLLRFMINSENAIRLEPTHKGALQIRNNIYQIYEEICHKITDTDKQQQLYSGLSTLFPCVIADTTNNRYIITVSINTSAKISSEVSAYPTVWVTIHDRVNSITDTHEF